MTLRLNGTTGYVELEAPANAGSNTLVLPNGNGTNGQVLSTNGSGALSWVQGGRILQVVFNAMTTNVNITSSSYTDTGITATITPASTSNKVLVLINHASYLGGGTTMACSGQVLRNSTQIWQYDYMAFRDSNIYKASSPFIQALDSPSSTSALTYKLQAKRDSGTDVLAFDGGSGSYNFPNIVLMEVAA